ncbi:3-phenylpropionate-dihydrodiol/cinnamic acid-dihydrodiol dehydrogenase [compost metagenome]
MYQGLSLAGKVTVITGGAGGIGQTTSELMIARGARVVVADLDIDRAQAVGRKLGDAAHATEVELTSEGSIKSMVAPTVDHFGRIDILLNNATAVGSELVDADRGIGEMETWAWDTFFDVNCRGTMIATRESLPHLIRSGSGATVNTDSGMALQGNICFHAYSARKAALSPPHMGARVCDAMRSPPVWS